MNNHHRASLLPLACVLLLIACCGVTRIRSHGNWPVVCPDERYTMHHTALHRPYCLRYFKNDDKTWYDSFNFCKTDEHGSLFYPEDNVEYGSAWNELRKFNGLKSWLGVRLNNKKYYTSNSHHERNSFWLRDLASEEDEGTHLLEIEEDQDQGQRYKWCKNSWYLPPKRPYLCNIAACAVDCDRLDALIAAFSALQ